MNDDDIFTLSELFPSWSIEDLRSLYNDLGRNMDLVITRISEGHASQWAMSANDDSKSLQSTLAKNSGVTHHWQKKDQSRIKSIPNQRSKPSFKVHDPKIIPSLFVKEDSKSGLVKHDAISSDSGKLLAASENVEMPIVNLPKFSENDLPVDLPIVVLPVSLRSRESWVNTGYRFGEKPLLPRGIVKLQNRTRSNLYWCSSLVSLTNLGPNKYFVPLWLCINNRYVHQPLAANQISQVYFQVTNPAFQATGQKIEQF